MVKRIQSYLYLITFLLVLSPVFYSCENSEQSFETSGSFVKSEEITPDIPVIIDSLDKDILYISITDTTYWIQMDNIHKKLHLKLESYLDSLFIEYPGPTVALFSEENDSTFIITYGIIVKEDVPETDHFKLKKLHSGKYVIAHLEGDYQYLPMAQEAAEVFIKSERLKTEGPPVEMYLVDPRVTENREEFVTEVFYRIEDE